MNLYSVVLFLHIVCVVTLSAALSLEWLSTLRLRNARSEDEIRTWINPVPQLPGIAITSMLLLLFSGIYLTLQLQVWALAWPRISFVGLLLLAPFGAISGRRIASIRAAIGTDSEVDVEELRRKARDPFLSLSLGVRTTVMLGIILIMTAKPTLNLGLATLGLAFALGTLFICLPRSRSISAATSQQS